MPDETKPAMAAEEWRSGMHWTATSLVLGRYIPDSGRGVRQNVGGFEIRVNAEGIPRPPGPRAIAAFTDSDAHAVAALALYGQPFGFTADDVRLLRMIAEDRTPMGRTARLGELADRIAALLPPPEHRHRCMRCGEEFPCRTPGICKAQYDVLPTVFSYGTYGEIVSEEHCPHLAPNAAAKADA